MLSRQGQDIGRTSLCVDLLCRQVQNMTSYCAPNGALFRLKLLFYQYFAPMGQGQSILFTLIG